MAIKGAIVVDTEHCKGCGVCLAACPNQSPASESGTMRPAKHGGCGWN